ncbi:MAG: putative porin, partial [Pyrinomonadaceae bacterium]
MCQLWFTRAVLVAGLSLTLACLGRAQEKEGAQVSKARAAESGGTLARVSATDDGPLEEVRSQLREQRAEIERLRAALAEQSRLLSELLSRAESTEAALAAGRTDKAAITTTVQQATYADVNAAGSAVRERVQPAARNAQDGSLETRVGRVEQSQKTVESLSKQLGSITFSGDIRLRYEGQFGLLNDLANSENPAIVGNELSSRNRARIRARLALRGQLGKEFDWGLRFATGTLPDMGSSNQTLTDFFDRKQFALDQAYVTYRPSAVPGLRLQGGKFETPWLFTEMTWDGDVQPEGLNETYARDFKSGALKNLTLVAWQLPLLERPSAFTLDASGRVNRALSERNGRDLALYGAQARARFRLTPQV